MNTSSKNHLRSFIHLGQRLGCLSSARSGNEKLKTVEIIFNELSFGRIQMTTKIMNNVV